MGPYSVFVTGGSYLAVVVDSRGFLNSPVRVGRDQGVEVLHLWGSSTRIVDEGMLFTAAGTRLPDDLPRVIDAIGRAVSTTEGTKVFHCTVLVKEGMSLTAAVIRRPNDLARVIYVQGGAVSTTEGTKVLHHTVLVEEGMLFTAAGTRLPDDLS